MAFLLPFIAFSQKNWTIYYTSTHCVATVGSDYYNLFDLKLIASDLAEQLEKATSFKFNVQQYNKNKGPGIFLLLDNTRSYQSNEQAFINSDNRSYITITAKYANGISYGVYTFLNHLGFKYYLPGDSWTIIPKLNTFFTGELSTSYKPAFKDRIFIGYFPSIKGVDEDYKNRKIWFQWCQRNRMGSEYQMLAGHVGETYNAENSELLKKEPDRLAPIDGKRQYSVTAKIDPTNKKSVEDYTNWAVKKYLTQKSNVSTCFPDYNFQSVDLGDGVNYCHTSDCDKEFNSISDQAFYIANIAAKKIRKIDDKAFVNTYAYGERADTPTINLEKNVFTQVIADGFQSISSPAILMKKWSLKTSNFGNYSYLNEAAYVFDQPFYNLKDQFNRLSYDHRLGCKGYTFETSISKFSSGLPQYFILKYLSEPYDNIEKEIHAFYKDCFPSCLTPVSKLFNSWYFNPAYTQTTIDRFTFFDDDLEKFGTYIDEALQSKNEKNTNSRLEELKIYFIYLVKLHEFNKPEEVKKMYGSEGYKREKINNILNFIWQYYDSFLFHNVLLCELLKQSANDQIINENWDLYNGNIANNLIKEKNLNIDQLYTTSRLSLKNKGENSTYISDDLDDTTLTRLAGYTAANIRIQLIDAEALVGFSGYINIYNPIPGKITIKYDYKPSKNLRVNAGFISIQSSDYLEVEERTIESTKLSGTVSFFLKRKGHYILILGQNQYCAANLYITPGRSLLYINKKILPVNNILLFDTTASPVDNLYLGLYTGLNRKINYHTLYFDSPNTLHFLNSSGVELKQIVQNPSPLYCSLTTNSDILYFKSDFFRWPPVFSNVAPYFFFFKRPTIQ